MGYRFDAVVFPVRMYFVSEPPSFSECDTRSRIARPYMLHQVWFMNELAKGANPRFSEKAKYRRIWTLTLNDWKRCSLVGYLFPRYTTECDEKFVNP